MLREESRFGIGQETRLNLPFCYLYVGKTFALAKLQAMIKAIFDAIKALVQKLLARKRKED
jgi:hypothetical protein